MKSRALKIIMFAMSIVFGMSLLVGCTNETPPVKYEDREVGDFVVRFYDDYCEIKGITEQGNSKRFLVIPEYVDGVRVESLGVYQPFLYYPDKLSPPEIISDKIEKIFFENTVKLGSTCFDGAFHCFECPNLKKVMYPGIQVYPYQINKNGLVYNPRSIYENCGYDTRLLPIFLPTLPANISYYYNYENAENDGYYWIDDCDYGSKIEFIPKDPTRHNYTFGGWYKEPQCTNKWDFETDTLPEEKKELKEVHVDGEFVNRLVTVYQETILYAKWI